MGFISNILLIYKLCITIVMAIVDHEYLETTYKSTTSIVTTHTLLYKPKEVKCLDITE